MEEAVEVKHQTGIDVLRQVMNVPMLVSSMLMWCAWVMGTRAGFSRPLTCA